MLRGRKFHCRSRRSRVRTNRPALCSQRMLKHSTNPVINTLLKFSQAVSLKDTRFELGTWKAGSSSKKANPSESWGRKVTGLRVQAYDSGTADHRVALTSRIASAAGSRPVIGLS